MFSASHTSLERNKIQSYLAIKYGLTLNSSVANYVSSSGASLWSDTTYWFDVFGIGKDDASGLNQPKSNSVNTGKGNGEGLITKFNIIISNPSNLSDGDFLMLGSNNDFTSEQTIDMPA